MLGRLSMILLSGAIGLSLTGCSATSPTMRAQSPCESGGCQPGGTCNPGYGTGCPPGAVCYSGAACHNCDNCQSGCEPCMNLPCHPVHRNFHTYDVPRNLSYPDASQPPAAVQYPYYTTRGPTDFFYQGP